MEGLEVLQSKFRSMLVIAGLLILVVVSSVSPLASDSNRSEDGFYPSGLDAIQLADYEEHDPILITCDDDFETQGWPGYGNLTHPYVIEGFSINASSGEGICIYDTIVHFIILDCYVYNAWYGILLVSSSNVKVESVVVNGANGTGICIDKCINCVLMNNTTTENESGFKLLDSNECTFTNNTAIENSGDGFDLFDSNECTFTNNTAIGNKRNGFYLSDSYDCTLTNNIVCYNSIMGICLDINCFNNYLYYNIIGWNDLRNAKDSGESNIWDDGVSLGNYWSDYEDTGVYQIPGSAGSVDNFPSPVLSPHTYETVFLLGGVLFLLPVGLVLGSRRHVVFDIIQRTSYRLVFWFRKRKDDKDDIVVPTKYRLVSRLRKKRPIMRVDVEESS